MSMFHNLVRRFRGPDCHLDAEQREWVDGRLAWLQEQFGSGPLVRPPLDHSSELLPRQWDRSLEAGADLLQRLCTFMLVDPARLHLDYFSQHETHELMPAFVGETHREGPAGLYFHPKDNQKLVIALEESGLDEPAGLVATICHELGHVLLLADGRISQDAPDSEPLTDLLTVYFGAGIFTANSAFQFSQWQSNSHQGWSMSRRGYLSEELFGYALACYASRRGETSPPWSKHLRSNILYFFDDSLHFLAAARETNLRSHAGTAQT
jgi:hypothetical protein